MNESIGHHILCERKVPGRILMLFYNILKVMYQGVLKDILVCMLLVCRLLSLMMKIIDIIKYTITKVIQGVTYHSVV